MRSGSQVASCLKALGVPHHNEVKVFEGVYHIDVVIGKGTPTDPKGHIALEVAPCPPLSSPYLGFGVQA